MGADFCWALAPIHLSKERFISKAKTLTPLDAASLCEESHYLHLSVEDDDRDEHFRDNVVARIIEAIEICYTNSRELDHITIEGKKYALTGGLSWGDPPTNVFEDVHILADFDYWLERQWRPTDSDIQRNGGSNR